MGQSEREVELWSALWVKPQAFMWERFGQQLEVALYVRNLALAELPGAPVNLGTLVRQMADSLGLTTPGLRSNRWKIDQVKTDEQQASGAGTARKAAKGQAGQSARERWKVIDGGAAS